MTTIQNQKLAEKLSIRFNVTIDQAQQIIVLQSKEFAQPQSASYVYVNRAFKLAHDKLFSKSI